MHAPSFPNVRLRCKFMGLTIVSLHDFFSQTQYLTYLYFELGNFGFSCDLRNLKQKLFFENFITGRILYYTCFLSKSWQMGCKIIDFFNSSILGFAVLFKILKHANFLCNRFVLLKLFAICQKYYGIMYLNSLKQLAPKSFTKLRFIFASWDALKLIKYPSNFDRNRLKWLSREKLFIQIQ